MPEAYSAGANAALGHNFQSFASSTIGFSQLFVVLCACVLQVYLCPVGIL